MKLRRDKKFTAEPELDNVMKVDSSSVTCYTDVEPTAILTEIVIKEYLSGAAITEPLTHNDTCWRKTKNKIAR